MKQAELSDIYNNYCRYPMVRKPREPDVPPAEEPLAFEPRPTDRSWADEA